MVGGELAFSIRGSDYPGKCRRQGYGEGAHHAAQHDEASSTRQPPPYSTLLSLMLSRRTQHRRRPRHSRCRRPRLASDAHIGVKRRFNRYHLHSGRRGRLQGRDHGNLGAQSGRSDARRSSRGEGLQGLRGAHVMHTPTSNQLKTLNSRSNPSWAQRKCDASGSSYR